MSTVVGPRAVWGRKVALKRTVSIFDAVCITSLHAHAGQDASPACGCSGSPQLYHCRDLEQYGTDYGDSLSFHTSQAGWLDRAKG